MYNKSLNLKKINKKINHNFKIHYGIVEYLADYDSKEAWEIRGISGRKGNSKKYFRYQQKKINDLRKKLSKNKNLQKKLDNFNEESLRLFNAILNEDEKIVNEYLNYKFYFILGAARTGGTFMLKEMSRAVDWPYKDIYMSILHEQYPNFDEEESYKISWRKPEKFYYILFQIVQFLVYINREFPNCKNVVKKTRFSKYMQLIDYLFGEKANYIVTIRHPGAINSSRIETQATGEVVDDFEKEANRTLYLWQNVYREIVRDGLPKGTIEAVLFGPKMDNFLKDFFKKHDSSLDPNKCKITKRSYNKEFWNSDYVLNSMDWVKLLWEIHDLNFPIPEKIL